MYLALQNLQKIGNMNSAGNQLQNLHIDEAALAKRVLCFKRGIHCLLNLQGLQIDSLHHGDGASLELKGMNTMGVVTTDPGSQIVMEDDEEGAGTTMDLLTAAGNMEVTGTHRIKKATTTAGAKIVSHGQRTKRAASSVEQAPEEPQETEEPVEEEAEATEEEETAEEEEP